VQDALGHGSIVFPAAKLSVLAPALGTGAHGERGMKQSIFPGHGAEPAAPEHPGSETDSLVIPLPQIGPPQIAPLQIALEVKDGIEHL
jgi:hypothetical protein